MASKRAQDRVTASKVREALARRRQVEEAVLVEAAAALEEVRDAEHALTTAQDHRARALGTAAWLLPEAEAAAVLGVSGQALRAAKRTVPAARAQQAGAELAGLAQPHDAPAPDTLPTRPPVDNAAAPGPVVH
jgi:hypothetical protein